MIIAATHSENELEFLEAMQKKFVSLFIINLVFVKLSLFKYRKTID